MTTICDVCKKPFSNDKGNSNGDLMPFIPALTSSGSLNSLRRKQLQEASGINRSITIHFCKICLYKIYNNHTKPVELKQLNNIMENEKVIK